jgi:hypothetical protein
LSKIGTCRAARTSHLGEPRLRLLKPSALAAGIVTAEGASKRVVQEQAPEEALAIIDIELQALQMAMPELICLQARHRDLPRVVANHLQEQAVLELGPADADEGPPLRGC